MSEILFLVALLVLSVVHVLMTMTIKRLSKEIDEIKVKLEHHQISLDYLESCVSYCGHKIDQLEDILELKEWFDKEPLNKE